MLELDDRCKHDCHNKTSLKQIFFFCCKAMPISCSGLEKPRRAAPLREIGCRVLPSSGSPARPPPLSPPKVATVPLLSPGSPAQPPPQHRALPAVCSPHGCPGVVPCAITSPRLPVVASLLQVTALPRSISQLALIRVSQRPCWEMLPQPSQCSWRVRIPTGREEGESLWCQARQ